MKIFRPELIVIHSDHGTVSDIRRRCVEAGLSDIGYHSLIVPIGKAGDEGEYEVVIGRPSTLMGYHCENTNEKSYAVCLIGGTTDYGFDRRHHPVPMPLWDLAVSHVADLLVRFNLTVLSVKSHAELVPSEHHCPGSGFSMVDFRRSVSSALFMYHEKIAMAEKEAMLGIKENTGDERQIKVEQALGFLVNSHDVTLQQLCSFEAQVQALLKDVHDSNARIKAMLEQVRQRILDL